MDTNLTSALTLWRARYPGEESQWRRLAGWLADHAPSERRAAKAVVAVARLELHRHLEGLAGKQLDPFSFRRIVDALTAEEGLSAELAEAAVLIWASALGVAPPDAAALRGPLDTGVLTASLDAARCLHLSMINSDLAPISQVRVESRSNKPLAGLSVSVWLTGVEVGSALRSSTWTGSIERLQAGQVALLDSVAPVVAPQPLHDLRAVAAGRWWIEVKRKDQVLLRTFQDIEVAPPRQWVLRRAPTTAIAAFVQPNDAVVAELVAEAAAKVSEGDIRPAAVRAFEALSGILGQLAIEVERAEPESIAGPRALLTAARMSLVEQQLLVAACLEHAGLSPMLIWADSGPALGLWAGGDRPTLTETDDPVTVARLVEASTLVVVPVGDHVVRLSPDPSGQFLALDLASARRAGVLPLPTLALDDGKPLKPSEARQRLLDRAALAGTKSGLLLPGAWSARLSRGAADLGTTDAAAPRLNAWKRRLLDLTLNNPLLNLRSRVTSLPLLVADLPAFEDTLAGGQIFGLLARPNPSTGGAVTDELMRAAVSSGSVLVDLPEARVSIQAKNALRAHREALDEGGVHTLFLTLGMLQWFDPASPTVPRLAPLLLVPVSLRRSRHGHFEMKKAEADTEFNAALLELLHREYAVDVPNLVPLPLDGTGVDVKEVFEVVRRALAKNPATAAWTVQESAQIAPVAFSGFRMWRDLDHQASDLLRHPLVRRLAAGGDTGVPFEAIAPSALDASWPAKDVLCPLDADASQLAAVLSAATGKSFVLEGPPGTGKSQTIANLVAQCLSAGKTVLFVAQKRAALEVVQARLDAVGLGPFLLELHSKKASKPEFIAQLKAAADFRARKPGRDWVTDAEALQKSRDELNAVVTALHEKQEPQLSVFDGIAELERRRGTPKLDAGFQAPNAFRETWLTDAKAALGDALPSFQRLEEGWRELEAVRATDWPASRRAQLDEAVNTLIERAAALTEACRGVSEWFPGLEAASADGLELADRVLADVQSTPRPTASLLAGGEEEVEAWLATVETSRKKTQALATRWAPALLAQPLDEWHGKLKQWMSVFLIGWLVLAFTVRWAARRVAKQSVPPTAQLVSELEEALALRTTRAELERAAPRMTTLLGAVPLDEWQVPQNDGDAIRAMTTWSRAFRNRATRFPQAQQLAAQGAPDVSGAVTAFRAAWADYSHALRTLTTVLDLSGSWTKPAEPEHLGVSCARARRILANAPQLRDWGAYRRVREACQALGLTRVTKALERGEVPAGELLAQFTHGWFAWWLEQRVAESPALASFDAVRQSGREERFIEADRNLRDLAREELRARVAGRMPRLDQGAPPTSQAGILLRQFTRKAGFASPRQLFSECAGLIRQLKPCVLMSPQSVAQYLDPSQPPFDVVVFDEASQVPTHEAIGAIARGRQVVVVGDSKQLPPTAFFLGQAREEDSEDDEVFTELESVLEECAASGLPSLQLNWHYRSRHPSLIAFSNARYYASRLQLFPAAQARATTIGVSRVLVKGRYDRGHTATNRVEAEALVADLVRRLRDPREQRRSLAVVTFSRAQQALIEDLLEDVRELNPDLEPFFDPERPEPLIVKNLENIQGDERDVVLFSIGYGPDSMGRMTANLGPLGQLGGERRLNVAVTRAREQLVVFVSFEPHQLNLSGSSARGLHDLKSFLDAAANGGDVVMSSPVDSSPSDETIKAALRTTLEAEGYVVDTDVGVGRYRLDLAVRHRLSPEHYALGIELDGAQYASSETARDRERLRRELLNNLGWRHLVRVRALEWLEAAPRVSAGLLQQLATLCAEPVALASTAPPAQTAAPHLAPDVNAPPSSDAEAFVPESAEALFSPAQVPPPVAGFSWVSREVQDAVLAIVLHEGPVSERALVKRLAELWTLKRAPAGSAPGLASLLKKLPAERRPVSRDGFLWPSTLTPETWRGYRVTDPTKSETRRDVDDIALEEIGNAADALTARYGAMPREELARALARRFGYRALTRGVHQRMEEGITFSERRRAITPAPATA